MISNNVAAYVTSGTIPVGTGYFVGIAAPLFGQPGGATQIWNAVVTWGTTKPVPWSAR